MSRKRAASREGMVVTTVALDADLHSRLAHVAVEERAALTELIRQAVREWLDRRQSRGRHRT